MQGKTIVTTGAFGALGRAVASQAESVGARVARIDYAPAPDGAGALAYGGLDLTDSRAARDVMDRIYAATGAIDALFNIAGGFAFKQLGQDDEAAWELMHAINLKTAVNASRAALPHLIAGNGAIVNVGANGALKAGAGFGPYAASKAGVHRLTESMAAELKGKVRVNAVLPSTLDTPANRREMPDADPSKWVAPADLANVMLFLASDDARAVTGALLPVMGQV